MKVKEVMKKYGADKTYIAHDECEGAYWERQNNGAWYNDFDKWVDYFDEKEALEVRPYEETDTIIVLIDMSLD